MPLIRVGQNIQIEQKLPDKNSGVFIRARLFDDTGAELPASPVTLSHLADGLYRNSSIPMPDTAYVTVITSIYLDAGFTNSAEEDYTDGVDIFERVDDLVKTNVVVPRSDEIYIEFETAEMEVLFEEEDEMEVLFDTEEISVEIDGDELDVLFDGEELSAELDC